MSLKPKSVKRTIFTDSDCHILVDIITSYKDIVECKKTDAVTWKQKAAAWERIAELYNSATTEPKTAEQLRCKFDNLKKDVRKYEAARRQSLIRTGGGVDEENIKETLKLLYAKIKSIISLSVFGLGPPVGDSDSLSTVGEKPPNSFEVISETNGQVTSEVIVLELEKDTQLMPQVAPSKAEEKSDTCDTPIHQLEQVEVKNDWSDYTPSKLQLKKHKVLQTKRKRVDSYNVKEEKEGRHILKKRLLEEEAERSKAHHEQKMRNEQALHDLKAKNLLLQNEKLELEILLLKKQL